MADRQWVLLMLEFKLFALRHGRLRAKLVEAHRRIRASLDLRAIKICCRTACNASRNQMKLAGQLSRPP